MLAARVAKKDAQKTKLMLLRKGLIDNRYKTATDRDHVYFPIKRKAPGITATDWNLEKLELREKTLKGAVKDRLTKAEEKALKTAFDTIGDIAILEIDEDLRSKARAIAEALLGINRNIRTVLRKSGGHEGEFRTQKMEFLAGFDKREALYKENAVSLKLDVEKVYFSPRLSTERKRIMQLVKKGERILVMFSGCGP
jgi:tRNA (guanine37-N1)-methyltransferase